ncbi:MAG TPA: class I SAM-dependent methyltransferase [Isosphaeraceae bacterium]|nr:class I SAM-dependent methyltransferase [Isosphaeraceae bacterium]
MSVNRDEPLTHPSRRELLAARKSPEPQTPTPPVLTLARDYVRRVLLPGDMAVDATVGNGHDTFFLANCVGSAGRVIGCDIQPVALRQASARLSAAGVLERVELLLLGHERLATWFAAAAPGVRVKAAMFNLGYMPGTDHSVITRAETTIPALESMLTLMAQGGIITAVLYSGHPGGLAETQAVLDWVYALPPGFASCAIFQPQHTRRPAPLLLAITPTDGNSDRNE